MKKHSLLKAGAATAVIALTMATPAFAQDADVTTDAAAESEDAEQAIVVTGTRLRSPNLESASPVTVVSAEEFAVTGTTRVEDLINSLPQVFAAQGANISNGATGTATLNLRGLGSERTLVLVNGRRLQPGTVSTSAADINIIPAALIERVDVLTGGASSVYGADAVAGVVNFVLDTDFEGFKINANYGVYNHNNRASADIRGANDARGFGYPTGMVTDGGTLDATVAFGSSFDDGRGRVTAYAGYRKIDPVLQARRDYSSCTLSANTAATVAGGGRLYNCGGSATSATGTVFYNTGSGADFTSTLAQFGPNRTLLPGFTAFNFGPLNYFQRPDERYTAGVFADYEISDAIKPYMEFMFMDNRTVAQIAPSGDFGNTLSINCDNPLLSTSQRDTLCNADNLLVSPLPGDAFIVTGNVAAENQARADRGLGEPQLQTTAFDFIDQLSGNTYNRAFAQILRRNVEGGARQDDLQHVSYRALIGVKGDLSPAWSYDAYYQYGRNNYNQTYLNDFSVTRLNRALDVVLGPDGVTPVCRSTLDGSDPNCVPWDIFSPGTVTPSQASVQYLSTPGFSRGVVSQQVASAFVSGSLGEYGLKTPWSDQGVDVVFGVEYRKESLEFNSDTAFSTGDLAGQGAATLPVSGSFDVKEFFTEVRLPIAQESWVHDFTLTGGYRYSDYSTGVNTDTYKIEAELAPVRDIRLRGGYNRAVRAPTVQNLFSPNLVALDGSSDPCSNFIIGSGGSGVPGDPGCIAQGLVVGQFVAPNPADQYNGFVGGNADLQPEIADTYTVGVVLTPTFLPGLTASVDYFDIAVEQAIQGIGSDTILAACTATSDPTFCSLINRDATGSLWRSAQGFVTNVTQNIGGFGTSGVDAQVNYSTDIGDVGTLTFNFIGTWLDSLYVDTGITIPDTDQTYDCVGLYGNVCGTPNPEWRHQARLGFNFRSGIGASVRWRYFDSVTLDAVEENTNLRNTGSAGPAPGGVARPGSAGFDAVNYFDLALTYAVGDNFNFTLGANNLFDKSPPVTGSQSCPAGVCNGNVYAQVYDSLGRYIFAGITLDF
jgi:outer membrane receptor protein involved in Fe transport